MSLKISCIFWIPGSTPLWNLFLSYLDKACLVYTKPQGAYYVMVDISGSGFASDVEYCEWLIKEIGVAAVPGSSFFHEPVKNMIRFHFAKKEKTLKQADERLLNIKGKDAKKPKAS